MIHGMVGRKVGMMRLYDGAGRARGVTAIQLGPNTVTQLRTEERDGYRAVQIGTRGNSKRLNRPARGHLRASAAEDQTLTLLREFPADNLDDHELGQVLTVEQFEAGSYVNVRGTSKGRGFAGGVKRWGFHGGPKTHGQSDRHRAPGSVGAGTTPGKVWKGQKMAGHMGARTVSVLNLLVVATDASRDLLFVEGSVPGPPNGIVQVTPGRKAPLAGYEPPEITPAAVAVDEPEPEPDAVEAVEPDEIEAMGADEVEAADEEAVEADAETEDEVTAAEDTDDDAEEAEAEADDTETTEEQDE